MSDKTRQHLAKYNKAYVRAGLYLTIAFFTEVVRITGDLKSLSLDDVGHLTWLYWLWAAACAIANTALLMRTFVDGSVEQAKTDNPKEP